MERRRRGSVEQKALSGRNTRGYANTRRSGIREEWDMHLGKCRYPALRGLQVARRGRSNPASVVMIHIMGSSEIDRGLEDYRRNEKEKDESNEGNPRTVGS